MSYYVFGDIHGEYDKLMAVVSMITADGFSLDKDHLVCLGDKTDRGNKSFEVVDYFYKLSLQYPNNVHDLLGNHEQMLIDACIGTSDLVFYNGGDQTANSYGSATGVYGKRHLHHMLLKANHWNYLLNAPTYYETDDYFFCHAPIAKELYRSNGIIGMDFRQNKHELIWTFVDGPTSEWVDPMLVPKTTGNEFKLSVYGHIHDIKYDQKNHQVIIPGIRRYGNSILIDTGSGCHKDGYLTCLKLPELVAFNSKGEKIQL